jgi:hypothetical protein
MSIFTILKQTTLLTIKRQRADNRNHLSLTSRGKSLHNIKEYEIQ